MKYKEAVDFIESVSWKGSVPGLSRITELCRLLGDPQDKLRFIHVAGTNGKGSVCAMLSSILASSGYKTGLFTSPHLIDYTERFKLDGADISKRTFSRIAEIVKEKAQIMEDAPTEFEILTAMAFVYFSKAGADIVVLECGMGGRLDATNVIPSPLVSVITNIALDHTGVLGDTELKIAREKAGIVKSAPVVIGRMTGEVENYYEGFAEKRGVMLLKGNETDVKFGSLTSGGIPFEYGGKWMNTPLCGSYQFDNIKTAIAVVNVLCEEGYDITAENVAEGMRRVSWQGRFEFLHRDPDFIYDGSHNPDGAQMTVDTFKNVYKNKKAVLLTGVMADKDYESIAQILSGISHVVYTFAPPNARALSDAELATVYSSFGAETHSAKSVKGAVFAAFDKARSEDLPVLCAGSLYSYSEVSCAAAKYLKERKIK
ncbi:MAG: bifunctional folylpolyglutamate synthase/dihydrofolate synthase [Clostridia bacterium]|nr:bifunctional folylpolyglutamate synthase/dihydrofolate synthase [Clostridia bacterium]